MTNGRLAPGVEETVGTPNSSVNAWGIYKNIAGKQTRCHYAGADGAHVRTWPMSELTIDNVRDRWGSGEYRVQWERLDPENPVPRERRLIEGKGLVFQLDEPVRPRAREVAQPAARDGLEEAMRIMALADGRSAAQLSSVVEIASVIAAQGNRGGMDATVLQLILDKQQSSTAALLTQINAQHEASMAVVRAELAAIRRDLDDDDDEPTPTGAPLQIFKAGEPLTDSVKAGLLNYAASNPEKILEALKTVPQVIDALSRMSAQQAAAQRARPQARVVVEEIVEEAPEIQQPGLNAFFNERGKPGEPVKVQ